ncbi:MAG: C39 family peptidase [Methanogenium sp.]
MRLAKYYYKGETKILEFPELRQTFAFDCGASAVQSVLAYYGYNVRESEIMKMAGTTEKDGTSIISIRKVLSKYNLTSTITDNMTIKDLIHNVDNGYPTMIAVQAYSETDTDYSGWDEGHWVLCIGYNNEEMFFEDPSDIMRTTLSYEELNRRWHDIDTDGTKLEHFGITIIGTPKYNYNDHERMK